MIRVSAPNTKPGYIGRAWEELVQGNIDPGPVAEEFAQALADWWKVPREWVLLTNSCTTAIGVYTKWRGGSEWAAPVFTWPGSYCMVGDTVKLLDGGDEWPYSPDRRIEVNLYGMYHYHTKSALLDCAHCFNYQFVRYRALKGRATVFSFGPTKEITTMRGGALVHPCAQAMAPLLKCNTVGRWPQEGWGMNGTITEVGAAMGLAQLRSFSQDAMQRRDILRKYMDVVILYEHVELITHPSTHSGHLAVIQFKEPEMRSRASVLLRRDGIQTSVHYPVPENFPSAHRMSLRVLSLPCHTLLTPSDMEYVLARLDRVLYLTRPGTDGSSDKE
jgi:dTDP-4-amino-4,6-dideoxygalactose transaminase